jgi:hypothetical protein
MPGVVKMERKGRKRRKRERQRRPAIGIEEMREVVDQIRRGAPVEKGASFRLSVDCSALRDGPTREKDRSGEAVGDGG